MKSSNNKNNGCCACGSGCCDTGKKADNNKVVVIDFLYLDLDTCTRCQGTDTNLEEAIGDVSNILKASGYQVAVNKINIINEELAIKHRFISSPTIRVNGRDIQMEIKESLCESCGDVCGDDVDCRVWVFENQEYTVPPKALIIDGILRIIYGTDNSSYNEEEYTLPENLKRFYEALKRKEESKQF